MLQKHYSLFCDECTKTEHLTGGSVKACEDEARNLNWVKDGKHWYCPKCHLNMVKAQANAPQES